MFSNTTVSRISSRRRPLAVGIATVLALSAPTAFAAPSTWPVTSCDDSGAGSLRDVIGAGTTQSGDTVDLGGLTDCTDSTISLSTGEIFVMQSNLTIVGPGKGVLTIDGMNLPAGETYPNDSRIFTHKGSGTLMLKDLRVANGHVYHSGGSHPSRGGCIYSAKNVSLQSVDAEGCSATSQQDKARGGGIYAQGDVTLDDSTITNNSVSASGLADGGGVATGGSVTATASMIGGNSTSSLPTVFRGGGIYAYGSVSIDHSSVSNNTATGHSSFGKGGGIYARGDLSLSHATLSGNNVTTTYSATCGGGAFSSGNVDVTYTTVDGNSSGGQVASTAGGGLCVASNFRMTASTVSGNTTSGVAGAIGKFAACAGCNQTFYLRDSTLSGNHAYLVGGVYVAATHTRLYNSTVAFNTATSGRTGSPGNYNYFSPGVAVAAFVEPVDVKIHSMLISNNTYAADLEMDLSVAGTQTVTFNPGPANSLIGLTVADALPSGIISLTCPLLGPLRDNGGPTKTHALMSTSPAIDAGDNQPVNFLTLDLYDQRGNVAANGVLDYLRVSGPLGNPNPLPDIGAYEVQQGDVVFNSGMDGCTALL